MQYRASLAVPLGYLVLMTSAHFFDHGALWCIAGVVDLALVTAIAVYLYRTGVLRRLFRYFIPSLDRRDVYPQRFERWHRIEKSADLLKKEQ